MLIYNTTFHAHEEIMGDCLSFFKKVYIPQAISGGELIDPRMAYIHHQQEGQGVSFSLQFRVEDVETLNNWLHADGHILAQKLVKEFGDKIAGFNTLLEEIDITQ
ncbi:DUF4286 family protein [Dysgonomonas sp. 520]|uniref:DUF4286 family protein n=1 Tax=Dysgonomonas sp. 520 TaxID=2302931 RepID=UPI0013D1FEB0|nr:DUF4286 family protein [Dysgonomonas sp. 520]NDW08994.1 DUF4286 family protein [Dysgonomonas sp. 520]